MGKNKFKKTKCGLIPEDWECVRLGEVGEFLKGQGLSKSKISLEGEYKCILYGELFTTYKEQIKKIISRTNYNEGVKSKSGDILFPSSTTTTGIDLAKASAILYDNILLGGDIIIFRKKVILNSIFLVYYLNIIKKIDIAKRTVGITIHHIYGKELAKLFIPLPPLKEQEKIAEILEVWDNAIEKIDKLIETKEEYKKGLMQQLLTGRMRFPGFGKPAKNKNELPENWKRVRLGYVGKVSMCKRVLKKYTKTKGEIPFYKIGTFASKPDSYINRDLYEEFKKKYPFPKKGDILISASGTIGRLVVYKGEDAYFQDSNIVWISNDEKIILNKLLYYVYHNVKWTTENSTISRLYNNNLRKIKFIIPSLSEQEKIAEILENIDKEIELLKKEKETYEIQKKGLMQQLLTGKIRVRIN